MTGYGSMSDRHVACSFCGRDKDEARKFISGPRVYVCDVCVGIAEELIRSDNEASGVAEGQQCSFCGKKGVRVWLVWGDADVYSGHRGTAICRECVTLCRDILREDDERERAELTER
jgi:ATP-dependent protease Clp ATPase subunit